MTTTLPLLVGSRGSTHKMLINFQSNFNSSVTSIPYDSLFPDQNNNQLQLYGLISKKILGDKEFKDGYIYCPENAYTLVQKVFPRSKSSFDYSFLVIESEELPTLEEGREISSWKHFQSSRKEFQSYLEKELERNIILLDPSLFISREELKKRLGGIHDFIVLGLDEPQGKLLFLVCPLSQRQSFQEWMGKYTWEEVYSQKGVYIFDEDGFFEIEFM